MSKTVTNEQLLGTEFLDKMYFFAKKKAFFEGGKWEHEFLKKVIYLLFFRKVDWIHERSSWEEIMFQIVSDLTPPGN